MMQASSEPDNQKHQVRGPREPSFVFQSFTCILGDGAATTRKRKRGGEEPADGTTQSAPLSRGSKRKAQHYPPDSPQEARRSKRFTTGPSTTSSGHLASRTENQLPQVEGPMPPVARMPPRPPRSPTPPSSPFFEPSLSPPSIGPVSSASPPSSPSPSSSPTPPPGRSLYARRGRPRGSGTFLSPGLRLRRLQGPAARNSGGNDPDGSSSHENSDLSDPPSEIQSPSDTASENDSPLCSAEDPVQSPNTSSDGSTENDWSSDEEPNVNGEELSDPGYFLSVVDGREPYDGEDPLIVCPRLRGEGKPIRQGWQIVNFIATSGNAFRLRNGMRSVRRAINGQNSIEDLDAQRVLANIAGSRPSIPFLCSNDYRLAAHWAVTWAYHIDLEAGTLTVYGPPSVGPAAQDNFYRDALQNAGDRIPRRIRVYTFAELRQFAHPEQFRRSVFTAFSQEARQQYDILSPDGLGALDQPPERDLDHQESRSPSVSTESTAVRSLPFGSPERSPDERHSPPPLGSPGPAQAPSGRSAPPNPHPAHGRLPPGENEDGNGSQATSAPALPPRLGSPIQMPHQHPPPVPYWPPPPIPPNWARRPSVERTPPPPASPSSTSLDSDSSGYQGYTPRNPNDILTPRDRSPVRDDESDSTVVLPENRSCEESPVHHGQEADEELEVDSPLTPEQRYNRWGCPWSENDSLISEDDKGLDYGLDDLNSRLSPDTLRLVRDYAVSEEHGAGDSLSLDSQHRLEVYAERAGRHSSKRGPRDFLRPPTDENSPPVYRRRPAPPGPGVRHEEEPGSDAPDYESGDIYDASPRDRRAPGVGFEDPAGSNPPDDESDIYDASPRPSRGEAKRRREEQSESDLPDYESSAPGSSPPAKRRRLGSADLKEDDDYELPPLREGPPTSSSQVKQEPPESDLPDYESDLPGHQSSSKIPPQNSKRPQDRLTLSDLPDLDLDNPRDPSPAAKRLCYDNEKGGGGAYPFHLRPAYRRPCLVRSAQRYIEAQREAAKQDVIPAPARESEQIIFRIPQWNRSPSQPVSPDVSPGTQGLPRRAVRSSPENARPEAPAASPPCEPESDNSRMDE